ncbi:MAG: hypothetical protein EXS14_02470 [Planctomycetes bacterium]|nr:hypothetical protein [Planctomycetota bacterium]
METRRSACPLDCPDACTLHVHVEDGVVRRIEGGHDNPLTAGFICGKVRNFAEHVYGTERVRAPLLRNGPKGSGEFVEVGWDAALDAVETGLRASMERHGPESVLPYCYGGSNGFLTQDAWDLRFFHRLGASRILRTFCAAPSGRAATGLYGRMAGVALEDYVHARCIVLWGVNPNASGIHLVPILKAARERGAKLIVVDPRRTPQAALADLHLQPRPGTDLPIALALANAIFERGAHDQSFLATNACEVHEFRQRAAAWSLERAAAESGCGVAQLEQFLGLYLGANPAVIRCGWGPERNRNGGSATAAILALPAIAGKFGVRGGGYSMSQSGAWKPDSARALNAPAPNTRAINMNQLGAALTNLQNPPVAALFVYNANPLATAPDQTRVLQGLQRTDLFTVVHEQSMTDTALHADVVLPATTFLEHRELARGYGSLFVQDAAPAIPPVGLARSNHALFSELLRRFGLDQDDDALSEEDYLHQLLEHAPGGERMAAELRERGWSIPPVGHTPVQFAEVMPLTVDGKVHLVPRELDREAPHGLYHYAQDPATKAHPLALISPARADTISSTFAQQIHGAAEVLVAPMDAAARGLNTGMRVRVWNAQGAAELPVRISADLRAGTVLIHKGYWRRHAANGFTSNALCPDTLADLGGGACFNDARVELTPL